MSTNTFQRGDTVVYTHTNANWGTVEVETVTVLSTTVKGNIWIGAKYGQNICVAPERLSAVTS